ncbi:MAG: protein phosphatase 2C domain-containing protein [Sulfurovum sp.]
MISKNIQNSGFSLAKRQELVGDDFYDIRTIGNLTVAVVCDGVGSASEGAEASKRTTNFLMNNFKIRPKSWTIEKCIHSFIKSINSILYTESQINYEASELVTTLTIVVIEGDRIYGANVGDSRIYLHRDKELTQLSQDHTMDEKGYENVLTKAIGIEESVEPFYFENNIQKMDKILLCSDGLYTLLSDEELSLGMNVGASFLVKKANKQMDGNLPDDTTAVVLDILRADELTILKQQKLTIPEILEEGQDIDGYILQKSLIQNDRTWLCSKKTKQYVLKFAPIEAIDDESILDLFIKEALNAKRIKNRLFPRAVIPKNRTHRYYVMSLVQGEDLGKYIVDKPLSVEDTTEVAKMLLDMSQSILKHDLVHGDIKPENIIINRERKFKMIDFGSMVEIFSSNSKAGTPSYLAPERFNNEAISESSEIFAIGVTLYYSLTHKYPYGEIEPFQNPTFKEPIKPSKYNKHIPDWLDSVILRAISIDKNLRYSHYSHFKYELTNPEKVKPFFSKNSSFIERSPLIFYKNAFRVMLVINFILGVLLWS